MHTPPASRPSGRPTSRTISPRSRTSRRSGQPVDRKVSRSPGQVQPLFRRPDSFTRKGLDILSRLVEDIMPLRASHRRDLPLACRDLSSLLTTERPDLERSYWVSPRLTSAYLRYFLPWNLVRLSGLLPGLDLGKPDTFTKAPLILDLGSGPLTLPLALWLTRPDLRSLPLTVLCADTSPHILDLGLRLFAGLRQELEPSSPWVMRTLRASIRTAPRRVRGKAGLLLMGNALNEVESRAGENMEDALTALVGDASSLLIPGGHLLAVEPGTRQGGRLIAGLRAIALEPDVSWAESDDPEEVSDQARGFTPVSPCPHIGPCPMLTRGAKAWCHVRTTTEDVPDTLRDLSRRAGMDKDSVSLSFVLLRREGTPPDSRKTPGAGEKTSHGRKRGGHVMEHESVFFLRGSTPHPAGGNDFPQSPSPMGERGRLELDISNKRMLEDTVTARILSDPFVLPGLPGRARYACTGKGLALVPDAARLPAGCLCTVVPSARRDGKSGAIIAPLVGGSCDDGRKQQ